MISNSRRENRPHAAFTLVRCASLGRETRCSGSAKGEMLSYVAAGLHFLNFVSITIDVKGWACANTLRYLMLRGLLTLSRLRVKPSFDLSCPPPYRFAFVYEHVTRTEMRCLHLYSPIGVYEISVYCDPLDLLRIKRIP